MAINMPGIHFREENTDLYHCLPWSHGSLAFLVGLKLKIIPTKPYIHMKWVDFVFVRVLVFSICCSVFGICI